MRRFVLVTLAVLFIGMHLVPGVHAQTVTPTALPDARVGKVAGTRAFVGLSVGGGRVRAYVCDGTVNREPTISQWFTGRWDGRSRLTLHAGGHVLRIDAGGTTGRFDSHRFTVRRATAPAGLFAHKGDPVNASWVVLPGQRLRGALVPTRPQKCRFVLVSGPGGTLQWVSVCGGS